MESLPQYNSVSAAEIFGSRSVPAVEELTPEAYERAILGGWYQGIALCVAVIFLICTAKYVRFMASYLLSAAGVKLSSRAVVHINPGEQTNIEIIMMVAAALFLPLAVVRGATLYMPELFEGIEAGSAVWSIGGRVLLALVLIFLGEALALFLIGFVSEKGRFCKRLMHKKLMHTSVGMAAILPFGLVFLLSPDTLAHTASLIVAIECLILLIIFVKETFLLFVSEKISILHWILYLCALEIFPASLMLVPLLRG
ncbi:MAG: DUF4271 domain-containing protein [Alistipes sp.]|nr:DUF4271 domain-containing protein [Alistipes sp.]